MVGKTLSTHFMLPYISCVKSIRVSTLFPLEPHPFSTIHSAC
uniref:Uncharacterized protein n=1 Tax=Anguilla anguilla TaxID=7936 RepID=A0A0E9PVN9_ANGAN